MTSAERAELFGFPFTFAASSIPYSSSKSNDRVPLRESAKERAAAEAEAARVREKQERDAASYTLGISPNSSIEQIRQAYLKLAMKFHPDKCPDGTENFKKILNAYEKLTTPTSTGGNKCRNRRRTYHRRTYHITKKTQTHRHATHHRKTHRVRD
jgi:hypothetical protein